MRLLQVRERNEGMAKDWLLFLATSKFNKLSAGEIYNAFKLAMSRELKDSKGNEFELLPELSNNTSAKVLQAYIDSKVINLEYQKAKSSLKTKIEEVTDQEVKERREKFIELVFEDIQDKGISPDAWILFDELEKAGKIDVSVEDKKKLYSEQLNNYLNELKQDYNKNLGNEKFRHSLDYLLGQIKDGKKNRVVQNRCRSILVCDYLKKFKDLETLKSELASYDNQNVRDG